MAKVASVQETPTAPQTPFAAILAMAGSGIGPLGAFGFFISGLSELNVLPVFKGGSSFGYILISGGFIATGIWWQGRRTTKMIATNAAKLTIENPNYSLSSPDPAINREIVSQLATGVSVPPPPNVKRPSKS